MRLYLFLTFLIISSLSLRAQSFSVEKEVSLIDSLVYFNQFDIAIQKIDSLNNWLSSQSTKSSFKNAELKLLYYRGHINAVRNKNSIALEIALEIIKQSKKYGFPEWEFRANLLSAGLYEQSKDLYKICEQSLNEAYRVYKTNNLEHLYSIYCIRKSSYYRIIGKKDSAIFFATTGLNYAKKYNNKREKGDGPLLLGILYRETDLKKSIHFSSIAAKDFLQKNDYSKAAAQYLNISVALSKAKQFDKSFLYADSAYKLIKSSSDGSRLARYFSIKQQLFREIGRFDSAYFYLNEQYKATMANLNNLDHIEIKKITEKYENEKKEELIKSQNKQFKFIASLLVFVVLTTLLVIHKNHKIKRQNIIINRQLNELHESLEVKKVLLSELQHRVKNNLQNIISILEIQKESIDFNNIDELIRANQNRINSMALLHQKLDISKNIDHIRLKDYVIELAMLVRDSYLDIHKNVKLDVDCRIEELSIQKAQPLGMIIVELVSNSIKYAFKKQNSGTISINIQRNLDGTLTQLHYTDDGIGFDPNALTGKKGLGLEIIYGLTDQLNGKVYINNLHQKGFAATISF